MPRYDVKCPEHGVHEQVRSIKDGSPWACAVCQAPSQVVISPVHARIDDAENIGDNRYDGTRGVNLGVPGVEIDLGGGRKGYRPITSAELGSNRRTREYARKHGLTPLDAGRYRCTR